MRSLAFFVEMLVLLPMITIRPFVGVLVWSWISFMSPHKLLWGPASDLPWALITGMALVIGCVIAREPKRFIWNPTTALIATFMICITLTSLTAMAPSWEVFPKWDLVTKELVLMLITSFFLTTKERIHALIWIMVLSLGFFGVKGGGFTVLHGGANRVLGPPGTVMSDNNQLAVGLLVTLPLMNYLRMQSQHRIVRIGLVAAMILTLFSVVGSYSRGALLGLAAVSVFLWLKSKQKLAAAVVLPIVVGSVILFMPPDWMERMHTITAYQSDNSAEGRLDIWKTAWQMAIHRPLTGAGFMGPYDEAVVHHFRPDAGPRAVHSIWFEVLGEHGFPTFIVWVGITVAGLLAARRIIKLASGVPELAWCVDLARMSQVSVVAYLVAGSFLSLSYWDFYFTILVAVAATHQYVRQSLGDTAPAGWQREAARLAQRPSFRGGTAIGAKARVGPTA
jgi:probable O-glycosylation ligase (exosortase A-associated)